MTIDMIGTLLKLNSPLKMFISYLFIPFIIQVNSHNSNSFISSNVYRFKTSNNSAIVQTL